MKQTVYYTIITHRTFFRVLYAITPECKILTWPSTFDDPGEASQEFKKVVQGNLECLPEGTFQRKVESLSARYQQDLAKLADWKSGKAVRI